MISWNRNGPDTAVNWKTAPQLLMVTMSSLLHDLCRGHVAITALVTSRQSPQPLTTIKHQTNLPLHPQVLLGSVLGQPSMLQAELSPNLQHVEGSPQISCPSSHISEVSQTCWTMSVNPKSMHWEAEAHVGTLCCILGEGGLSYENISYHS